MKIESNRNSLFIPRHLEDQFLQSLLDSKRKSLNKIYLGVEKEWEIGEYRTAKFSLQCYLEYKTEYPDFKWGYQYCDQWNWVVDPRLFQVAWNELSAFNSSWNIITDREIFHLDKVVVRRLDVLQGMTLRFDHMGALRWSFLHGRSKRKTDRDLARFYQTMLEFHTDRGFIPGQADAYLRNWPGDITYLELCAVKFGYLSFMKEENWIFKPIPEYSRISGKSTDMGF